VGFAAGLLVAPKARLLEVASEPKVEALTQWGASAGNGAFFHSRSDRPPGSERKPKGGGARISISQKEIAKVICLRVADSRWFQKYPVAKNGVYERVVFSDVSRLLEVSESEEEEVHEIFKDLLKKLQIAESLHLKATQTNPSEITLDFSEMVSPVNEIFAEAQENLRSALPGERGETLALGVSSQSLYMFGESEVIRLTIERERSGGLMMHMRYASGGGAGNGLRRDLFPDDGSLIPADQVFGDRWKSVLSGMTLLPVDEKQADP